MILRVYLTTGHEDVYANLVSVSILSGDDHNLAVSFTDKGKQTQAKVYDKSEWQSFLCMKKKVLTEEDKEHGG
jgi:hypothetical protein